MSYAGLTSLALDALHAAPGHKPAAVPAEYLPALEVLLAKHLIVTNDIGWCCTELGRTLRDADRKLSAEIAKRTPASALGWD